MPNILPANRVAAIATWLTALGALIAAVEGTLPTPWMNTALALGALITKLAVTLHFMTGSQKFDALIAKSAALAAPIYASGGNIASGWIPTPTASPAAVPDTPMVLQEIAADEEAALAAQAAPGTAGHVTPEPAPVVTS